MRQKKCFLLLPRKRSLIEGGDILVMRRETMKEERFLKRIKQIQRLQNKRYRAVSLLKKRTPEN
jgi:hypothetical protein